MSLDASSTYCKKTRPASLTRLPGAWLSSRVLGIPAVIVAAMLQTNVASATPILGLPTFATALRIDGVINTSFSSGTIRLPPLTATASGSSVLGSVLGSATASAHAASGAGKVNRASSTVNYDFAVLGPTSDTPIPLLAKPSLRANVSVPGTFEGFDLGPGKVSVAASVDLVISARDAAGKFNIFPRSVFAGNLRTDSIEEVFTKNFSEPIRVFLFPTPNDSVFATSGHVLISSHADIFVGDLNPGFGSADAFGDPFIFIDPEFLLLNPDYSVIVSTGISNEATVVPLPAAVSLFGFALGSLGFTPSLHLSGHLNYRNWVPLRPDHSSQVAYLEWLLFRV